MRRSTQAAFASLLLVVACRQAVGIENRDPPPRCAAPASASSTCADCLVDRCCDELVACEGAACATSTEASAALPACEASRCGDACGLACGGAGPPITDCKPCGASCCAEGAAFRGSTDGQQLLACRAGCKAGDVACREACANRYPLGAHLEHLATECVARSCAIQGSWSCVGAFEPAAAATDTLSIDIQVIDAQTLVPLSNVTVKGCALEDLDCKTPPHGTATTDATGSARLTVKLAPATGLDAYPGFFEIGRDDYVVELVYFLPAITASGLATVPLVSKALLQQLEAISGAPIANDHGMLLLGSVDCGRRPAPGVSFRSDALGASARAFYLKPASGGGGSSVDFAATSTTEVGFGGILDVPAGTATITARVDDLCLDIATASLGVRAGATTFAMIPPLR